MTPWSKIGLRIFAAILFLLGGGALLIGYALRHSSNGGEQQLDTKVEVAVGGTFDVSDPSLNCCSKIKTSASINTILEVLGGDLLAMAG